MALVGAFRPVLAKHTKHLSLVDILSVGVDRMQRNFEPMRKQVEAWKGTRLPDETAKFVIYHAFVAGDLDVPKHLARRVHDVYFNPQIDDFAPRTTWSLSNAFTSAFKELDAIPQFKATAKLTSFLEGATTAKTNCVFAISGAHGLETGRDGQEAVMFPPPTLLCLRLASIMVR